MDTLKIIIRVLGLTGEFTWIVMIILSWFGSESIRDWFKTHKIVTWIIMIFVIIGWLYFVYQVSRGDVI